MKVQIGPIEPPPAADSAKVFLKRWLVVSIVLAVIGLVQFCVLTWMAIVQYRGFAGEPYSMSDQFLSYLGASGSNVKWKFNSALIGLGLLLLPFFSMLPGADKSDTNGMKFAALAGFFSALGLIGLGTAPVDENPGVHNMMLALWAIPTPIFIVCFLAGLARSRAASWWFLVAIVLVGVGSIGYLIMFPPANIVIFQKVSVCFSILWFVLIVCHVLRSAYAIVHPPQPPSLESQTLDYIDGVRQRFFGRKN